MPANQHPIVYTIGHGTKDFHAIAAVLDNYRIATLIDVRSRPYSRHAPDFRRETLSPLARTAGFGYRWFGNTLGGLDETPHPASFLASITQVISLARTAPVALLCAEGEPTGCHRSTLLAPRLEDMGARVVHILPDGSARPHQPTLGF
ncbi:MAG: DUF488 domain-containing protein [Actinobacteria bacterium]|nr:DUF488 domain-containing protein [Actinomycetota bacterium]